MTILAVSTSTVVCRPVHIKGVLGLDRRPFREHVFADCIILKRFDILLFTISFQDSLAIDEVESAVLMTSALRFEQERPAYIADMDSA